MSLAEQVGNESAELDDIIQGYIRMNQLELNTAIPGTITEYDALLQTCSVQPSIKRRRLDGETFSRKEISEVPVVFPRSKTGGISFPLSAGDGVLLVFSQRSIEEWGVTGDETATQDTRLHNISDAIAIPGLFSLAGAMVPPQEDATEVRGEKIFVGDPLQFLTPFVTVPASPVPGTLTSTMPTEVVVAKLDIVNILAVFMELMLNASYGGAPNTGGGGIDTTTKPALKGLLEDLEKLKT